MRLLLGTICVFSLVLMGCGDEDKGGDEDAGFAPLSEGQTGQLKEVLKTMSNLNTDLSPHLRSGKFKKLLKVAQIM